MKIASTLFKYFNFNTNKMKINKTLIFIILIFYSFNLYSSKLQRVKHKRSKEGNLKKMARYMDLKLFRINDDHKTTKTSRKQEDEDPEAENQNDGKNSPPDENDSQNSNAGDAGNLKKQNAFFGDDEQDLAYFDEIEEPEKLVMFKIPKKYGNLMPLTINKGFVINRYPSCIVTNKLHTQFLNNDQKNQKFLKKCAIKHILKSIDFDKKEIKFCAKMFKKTHKNKNDSQAYGYFLAEILSFAADFDIERATRKFDICGRNFVDQMLAKATEYRNNFMIASSMFADLTDLRTSPPKDGPNYYFTTGKRRKHKKLKN